MDFKSKRFVTLLSNKEGNVYMNYYRNSSLMFLFYSIFPVFLVMFLFIENVDKKICFGLGICYSLLVISVALPIFKRRTEIKEILKKGKCYNGKVEKLIEIEVGATYNRFGNTEYDSAYCLKVIPQEEITGKSYIYSDILIGKKGQKISQEVLIYDWYGKTFVDCIGIKKKQHYKVEQMKEVMQYSWNRKCLIYINRITVILDILLIIVWVYIKFIEM